MACCILKPPFVQVWISLFWPVLIIESFTKLAKDLSEEVHSEVVLPLKIFSEGSDVFVQELNVLDKVCDCSKAINIDEGLLWGHF